MRRTLAIMLKEPRPGRVKTRLGREIGMTTAVWWFRHQATELIRRLQDPRWDVVLVVSPDSEGMKSRVWPRGLRRVPQGKGDLGARMKRVLQGQGPGPVCVIGSDIPEIERHHIARAFKALGPADAVLGPAYDGGFWLIGLKNARPARPQLFQSVRWSTHYALTDTVRSLGDFSVAYVDKLHDVDTTADLRMTPRGQRAT